MMNATEEYSGERSDTDDVEDNARTTRSAPEWKFSENFSWFTIEDRSTIPGVDNPFAEKTIHCFMLALPFVIGLLLVGFIRRRRSNR